MVLEALTWRNRLATKDIADPCTLLTITHQHRDRLSDWKLHSARTGVRKDAARALHELVAMLDRGQRIDGMAIAPARLSGLIRRYVADPHASRPPADSGTATRGRSVVMPAGRRRCSPLCVPPCPVTHTTRSPAHRR